MAQNYTNRLLHGGSLATRLSHRGRIGTALKLLDGNHFETAADVGAADGWYLQALLSRGIIGSGVAIDADPAMLEAGELKFREPNLSFHLPNSLGLQERRASFDLVACMETLEHVEDPIALLHEVLSYAKPGGTVLVSVPIEAGPSIVLKQAGRWWANRGGGYSYERYTWKELVSAGLLWDISKLRPQNLHSHKGFDYRLVRRELASATRIRRTVYSPFQVLGPVVASTVYWVATAPES